jgi:RNA polymerase sigma-70 factor (ECF subfamily)
MLVDFGSLFERYSQDVYRFAVYLSGDQALAEDICQETFVRAWVTPGEIRASTVKSYLFMIARNLYRDELTRKGRHVAMEDTALDPKPGPDAVAGGRLELAAVLQALQGLPEIDRAALLMSAQDGMSHAEIAATLDLSVTAVKVKIHRARIRLKRIHNPGGI